MPRSMQLSSYLGALVIAGLPFAVGVVLRDFAWGPWLGVGVAVVGGVGLSVVRPLSRGLVLLGGVLAAGGALMAPRFPTSESPPRIIDLREQSLPPDLRGSAEVTGFFRDEWVLAEYAVPDGELPQQDGLAAAQLVPFVGSAEGPIPLRDAVLIVRGRPGDAPVGEVSTVRGHARALEDELLATFVQASGLQVPEGVEGIVLDTVGVGDGASAWWRGALAVLVVLSAATCLSLAVSRSFEPSTEP